MVLESGLASVMAWVGASDRELDPVVLERNWQVDWWEAALVLALDWESDPALVLEWIVPESRPREWDPAWVPESDWALAPESVPVFQRTLGT